MTEKKLGTELLPSTLNVGLRAIGLSALILLSTVTARPDTVLDWNVIALKTTAAAPFNPPLESRNLAIVHAAMFDAVNSIVGEFRLYAVELSASNGASPDAAAAAAAHFALRVRNFGSCEPLEFLGEDEGSVSATAKTEAYCPCRGLSGAVRGGNK